MREFDVTITETLQMTVPVEAKSREEAEEIARKCWKNGDYILDAGSFAGVKFHADGEQEHEAPGKTKKAHHKSYGHDDR